MVGVYRKYRQCVCFALIRKSKMVDLSCSLTDLLYIRGSECRRGVEYQKIAIH